MLWRFGMHLARHAGDSLSDQRQQRPAGTIPCQHIQIMNMDQAAVMRFLDRGIIDLAKPVISGDGTGIGPPTEYNEG